MRKVLTMTIKSGYSAPEQESLWGTGFERISVSHYDEVLEGIRTHAPDMVVLDGLGKSRLKKAEKTLLNIRKQKEIKDTSLAVLTSLDISPSEEEQLISAGANIIIPVPSDPKLWNLKLERLINIPTRHRFRVPVQIVAWTKMAGSETLVQGMALNISLGGMLLQLPLRLAPEGKFDLLFNLPGDKDPLSLVGRIVWRNEASQKYGIEFLVYRGDSRSRLARFLDETYEIYEIAKKSGQYLLGDASREAAWEILLRTSEARKKAIMDAVSDCIIAVDHEDRILEFNEAAERTFGISKNQVLLNRSLDKLLPQDLCKSLRNQLFGFVAKGASHRSEMVEAEGRRADGSAFPIEISSYAMYFEREPLLIVYLRDISERKRNEEERARLEESLHQGRKMETIGRLVGGIAHDYNNMLGVILGYAEIAQLKVKDSDPLREDLGHILDAAKRSRDITQQLLAFARKQSLDPQVINLNSAIEHAVKILKQLLGEDIDLLWSPRKHLWLVEIDPSQFEQILANLCVNARDAIQDVGRLTIRTDQVTFSETGTIKQRGLAPGEYVLLEVADNGCGMDNETLAKIFEPFFTTKEKGSGTGLGLATVYGIVNQSGGFIETSSQVGKGTTFRIFLPRSMRKTTRAEAEVPSSPFQAGDETVLVVDDEKSILNLTKTLLDSFGFQVLTACSPTEALALSEQYQDEIHLLISDVIMPEMNGRELAERLKAHYPELECLFISGYSDDVLAPCGILEDKVRLMAKPFTREELGEQVQSILKVQRQRTEAISPVK